MLRTIVVVPYDPAWPAIFEAIAGGLREALGSLAVGIEHVGSTSVPELAAKPVIDLDLIISSRVRFEQTRDALHALGYRHRGNLGIPGREAFLSPQPEPSHHLYVCPVDAPNLSNHLMLRDVLRRDANLRAAYGALKYRLADDYPHDIDAYVEGKSEFIEGVLARAREEFGYDRFQPPAPINEE